MATKLVSAPANIKATVSVPMASLPCRSASSSLAVEVSIATSPSDISVTKNVLGKLLSSMLGLALGVFEGAAVDEIGETLGVELGVAEGVIDGVELGVAEGVIDGVALGVVLGVMLGVALGVMLGVALGVALGVLLGVLLGVEVGPIKSISITAMEISSYFSLLGKGNSTISGIISLTNSLGFIFFIPFKCFPFKPNEHLVVINKIIEIVISLLINIFRNFVLI